LNYVKSRFAGLGVAEDESTYPSGVRARKHRSAR